jgi:hypothetical protein
LDAQGESQEFDRISLRGVLRVFFQNFGRSPAYVRIRQADATIEGVSDFLRVPPTGVDSPRSAALDYLAPRTEADNPFVRRKFEFWFEVTGPMTPGTTDTIRWYGELTLLRVRGPQKYMAHPHLLRQLDYKSDRSYPGG